jgi:hypothetical protein
LLINSKTVTGTLNGTGAYDIWYIFVSSNSTRLDAVLTCLNGTNFDLYGRFMDPPTLSDWDWAGTRYGSEVCNVTDPLAGWWYIMPYAQSGSGPYQLTVNITYSSTAHYLNSGRTVLSYLNGTGDSEIWVIWVDNGATSMRSDLGTVGWWLELYEMVGATPSTSSFSACSWGYPDLTVDHPSAGWWYIMPYAYGGSGIYQLTVTITYGDSTDGSTGLVVPIFYGLVIGLVLLSLFGVLIVSKRRSEERILSRLVRDYYSSSRPAYPQEEPHSAQEQSVYEGTLIKVPYRKSIRPVSSKPCARCGARMKVGDEYCWNCGAAAKTLAATSPELDRQTRARARFGVCMVCKLPLVESDEILLCPYCRGLAHKYELLEWLHVKDHCPSCGRHLSESKVKKRAIP